MTKIRIKNVYLDVEVPEGTPAVVRWWTHGDVHRLCTATGCVMPGRRPGTVDVVSEETWDRNGEPRYRKRTLRIGDITAVGRPGKEKWCKCPI